MCDSLPGLSLVWDARCLLGESPVWSDVRQTLFFVDIKGKLLLSHSPGGENLSFPLGVETGSIVLAASSHSDLIAAQKNQFCRLSLAPWMEEAILLPEGEPAHNRFNDGKCDAAGRFWAATMDDLCEVPTGKIWCLSPDGSMRSHEDGFIVGNGFGWSLDNRTMYFTDSEARQILAYEFDLASGTLGTRRCFATVDSAAGYPDGLVVDADDHVWSAHWDGGCITRYRPDGTVERVVTLPISRPTSLAFGGRDYQSLYITSARTGLDAAALQRAPLSGGLFELRLDDVKGLPPMVFGVGARK